MSPFADRHVGPDRTDLEHMLGVIGVGSLEDLVDAALPGAIRSERPHELPDAVSEAEALAELASLAARNERCRSVIGMGYVGTITPGVIARNVLENPAWYTSYTPYQPEISQGRLEALLNFQTMVADLTGMDLANASLLDEGTAAAEAMTMCRRVGRSESTRFFVDEGCHPQTLDVVATRAEPLGIELVVGDPLADLDPTDVFAALFQDPATDGVLRDLSGPIAALHDAGALAVVAADLLACCLVVPPGERGADVVVGSSQRFGVPMGFGGPHAAFLATRERFARSLPGRLVGVSVDTEDRTALRLALQTREQHIRREKATSNICTAQVLLAVIAGFYGVYHGPDGLRAIAERVNRLAVTLTDRLRSGGVATAHDAFFDTVVALVPGRAEEVVAAAREARINLRRIDDDRVGVTLDETCDDGLVAELARIVTGVASVAEPTGGPIGGEGSIPVGFVRESGYLEHPVFSRHRSETAMLRYLRRLSDRDLALDRTSIPLGSCTMKLNATSEMVPITWPEFAEVHPFAPLDQTEGYRAMIADLERWLAEITGYDAVSVQPNAGSQGEYAGLLAIRAYHRSRGDDQRTVCLIPSSAHGTNAASAVLAGLDVVVVACDEDGNIDVADLERRAADAGDRLAALMVTYPSTHGVYEEAITRICDLVHDHGGQVYLDGANLNAMVGLSKPGDLGADVSHLNLHKTFAIPHGGGGPGMGPIGVKAHLAPHLPGHPETDGIEGPVSGTPFGSPSILLISWAYCMMMGGPGLTQATRMAILSANYLAKRLEGAYDVLYKGPTGRVAHECILDTRAFADEAGITVDDIAKRLMDNGFHAPTMSWPVAGTLMVEPTESETKAELDRFVDAMLSIREEIRDVADGRIDAHNNPLKHAPHTVRDLVAEWDRPYSREQGCFPPGAFRTDKYWPPVGRVDNVYGDRNLVCTCPPLESYKEAAE